MVRGRSSSRAAFVGATAIASLVAACSTPSPPPIDPAYDGPPRAVTPAEGAATPAEFVTVSNVSVEPDPDAIPADRLERYRAHDAGSIIRRSVFAQLAQLERLNSGSEYRLAIRVTAFRLRSASATVWGGTMSGNDNLTVIVEVLRGDSVVRSFSAHVASIKGGIFYPSSAGRLNNLARALAEDVVAKIWRS